MIARTRARLFRAVKIGSHSFPAGFASAVAEAMQAEGRVDVLDDPRNGIRSRNLLQ